jgi:hypothetical protein
LIVRTEERNARSALDLISMKKRIKQLLTEGKSRKEISSIMEISLKATQSIIDRMNNKEKKGDK